jgi:hypothetical protein
MTRGFGRFLRQNTIALLALFIALGGTTYAASTALIGKNSVASPQVVNGSLQAKDLSKKARKALKGNRGLRGLTGQTGQTGATGSKGATGAQGVQGMQGVQGIAGTARAYGLVNSAGTTVTRSKGVVSITQPGAGEYCILLDPSISISTTGGVVSPDYSTDTTGATNIAHAEFVSTPSCPAGNYVKVRTFQVTANGTNLVSTNTNQGFFFSVP